jgi:hypothetical protein
MNNLARSLIETLPLGSLPRSAAVDALHMAVGTKSAIRTRLADPRALDAVTAWSDRHGLTIVGDEEGYVCIAAGRALAALVLEIDRKDAPHEASLGRLLGYPPCCCEFVAQCGEARIDELAGEVARWAFDGTYQLIDPTHYVVGRSLVCHLPCSPTCGRSLQLARTALGLVRLHFDSVFFRRWEAWLDVLQSREPCDVSPRLPLLLLDSSAGTSETSRRGLDAHGLQ